MYRRGIYDSVALGCIPVFFVQARKPWDTFLDYSELSVLIKEEDRLNFVDILKQIPNERKLALKTNLKKYAQFFQWSFGVPPIAG